MSVGAVNKQTGERIPTAGMPAVDSVLSGSSTNPVQNKVVKEALDGKQDTLTFDDTPTDGSNNPVKSNGIYDALATKANTDMVAADFNAGTSYTAENYCVQDGKLYKFKNNHSGAWSSADVDEVKITGELSALKSGLNDVNSNISTLSNIVNGITYGSTANPLNIDTISGMYYYLCCNDGGLSGDLPITLLGGGSTFLLIGFSHNVTHGYGYGVQIAIDFTDSSIAIRNSTYNSGSWGAWRKIASSAS